MWISVSFLSHFPSCQFSPWNLCNFDPDIILFHITLLGNLKKMAKKNVTWCLIIFFTYPNMHSCFKIWPRCLMVRKQMFPIDLMSISFIFQGILYGGYFRVRNRLCFTGHESVLLNMMVNRIILFWHGGIDERFDNKYIVFLLLFSAYHQ